MYVDDRKNVISNFVFRICLYSNVVFVEAYIKK